MRHIFALLLMIICLTSCNTGKSKQNNEKPVIAVTIEPQRYFTEAIAGDKFDVISIVPKGILASNKSGWIVSQTIPPTSKYSIRRKM